jgi:hypothetical protein
MRYKFKPEDCRAGVNALPQAIEARLEWATALPSPHSVTLCCVQHPALADASISSSCVFASGSLRGVLGGKAAVSLKHDVI